LESIDIKLSGILIVSKEEQPAKVLFSIVVMPLGITTDCKDVQFSKAPVSIFLYYLK
jgi:hypothetical protein